MSKCVDTMIKEDFLKLGFSDKEAEVYLALVKTGPSVASVIARLTRIKRTSVYDVLNSLLERNFVATFKQGAYVYFYVDDINKIYIDQKDRLNVAQGLSESLKMYQAMSEGMQINYYKGIEGYKEMYEDILKSKTKEICGWMDIESFYKEIDMDYEMEWMAKRVKKGVSARLIVQDSPMAKEFQKADPKVNRRTMTVPAKDFPFKTTCLLYDGFVSFFDPSNEFAGVRIAGKEIYNMQQQIFEMNWKLICEK